METVVKKAQDPITGKKYEVELPGPEVVRQAILELNYPSNGIRIVEATDILSEKFQLSYQEKKAKNKRGDRYLDVFRYDVVAPAFDYLLNKGKLKQPWGKRKPYVLANTPPTPPDYSESIEEIYQQIRKKLARPFR